MAKYKVGDKVRVRSDLERFDSTGKVKQYHMEDGKHNTVVDNMLNLAGKIVTIVEYDGQYYIEETGSLWHWTDEMFEGLAEEAEFHVYDTVKHEKYGIGTVIALDKLSSGKKCLLIEFDRWDEDFPDSHSNEIWLLYNEVTVIQSNLPN